MVYAAMFNVAVVVDFFQHHQLKCLHLPWMTLVIWFSQV
jgi:hypothetical protein